MRRIAAVLTLTIVLGVTPHASAQDASAGVRTGQFALAMWTTYKHGKPRWFYVAVMDRSIGGSVDAVETYVVAARGRCRNRKLFTVCTAGGRMHQASLDEASFDAMQRSATMSYRRRRFTHTATWTADDDGPDPAPYVERYSEDGYTEVYGGLDSYREARAGGKLYGTKMRTRRGDGAFMWQGTWGYAYSFAGANVAVSRDGVVTVTARR